MKLTEKMKKIADGVADGKSNETADKEADGINIVAGKQADGEAADGEADAELLKVTMWMTVRLTEGI